MIGTVALARRIEAAETRLSLAMSAVSRDHGVAGAFGVPVAGGAAVFCGPGSPMTKVIGVGMQEPLTPEDLDAVEAAFGPTGESPGVEVSTLADLGTVRLLERRGYRLQRIELVLAADLSSLPLESLPAGVAVTRGAEADWARILVDGFAAAETVDGRDAPAEHHDTAALEAVIALFAGVTDVRRYVATLDAAPVGAGSARVDEGIYQLCGAATVPASRRRGVQSALLTARLADARAEGCDLAVVAVEPGSRSQANAQSRGFEPLYSRLVLAKDT